MAATIKTMGTKPAHLGKPIASIKVSSVLNFNEESPKRSAMTLTIFSYSGEPVVAYFSRFLFSSPSSSLIMQPGN